MAKTPAKPKGAASRPDPRAPAAPPGALRRWLLLVHQLPASPSNLRVRTWRRLQELGAVGLKQSVYVLPDSADAREDFEWLKVEIEGSGGEASVFSADLLDSGADAALVEEFRRLRQAAYAELAAELQRLRPAKPLASARVSKPASRTRDQLSKYRQRLAAIERVDFFSSAGRDRVISLLSEREGPGAASSPGRDTGTHHHYRNRLWVTRPLPGVDRMGSAWLIRRFIDSGARFGFCTDAKSAGPDAVSFDMFGGDFTHHGQRCTFETLCATFEIRDPAVARLAEVVHDLDLKDARFKAPEAPTVGAAIEGLQLSCTDDSVLLEQGATLFEALYRSFAQAHRPSGPKPVARRKK
jgi:hypothetical protein